MIDSPFLILIITMAVVAVVICIVVFFTLGKQKRVIGLDDFAGMKAKALSDLDPAGKAMMSGETWKAKTKGEKIEKGAELVVVGKEGLTLIVEKRAEEGSQETV